MRYLGLVVILLISLTLVIPLTSAEDESFIGWVWNGITSLWENWFSGNVIATSTQGEELGQATIQTTGEAWTLTKATDEESNFTLWTSNASDKKSPIGLLERTGTTSNHEDKCLYDENNVRLVDDKQEDIKELKWESGKCDGQDCYYKDFTTEQLVNIPSKIKWGSCTSPPSTLITEYQNQTQVNYQLPFAGVNVSLTCEDVAQNDIAIREILEGYKFNATGTFEGLRNCTYTITSNYQLEYKDNIVFLTEPNPRTNWAGEYYKTHQFKFHDICNKDFEPYNVTEELGGENITVTYYNKSADCVFEVNDYNATITFLSDKNIDPKITDLDLDAVFDNVICEGGGIYCHLNISESDLIFYESFDIENEGLLNRTTGKVGKGISFDGAGTDWLWCGQREVGTPSPAEITNENFTFAFWAYPLRDDAGTVWYGGYEISVADSGWMIGLDDSGQIQFGFAGDDDATPEFSASNAYATNEWVHIVLTKNSSNYVTYYVNGSRFDSDDIGTSDTVLATTQEQSYLGAGYEVGDAVFPERYFQGSLDEVKMWTRVLSDDEINNIYTNESIGQYDSNQDNSDMIFWWNFDEDPEIDIVLDQDDGDPLGGAKRYNCIYQNAHSATAGVSSYSWQDWTGNFDLASKFKERIAGDYFLVPYINQSSKFGSALEMEGKHATIIERNTKHTHVHDFTVSSWIKTQDEEGWIVGDEWNIGGGEEGWVLYLGNGYGVGTDWDIGFCAGGTDDIGTNDNNCAYTTGDAISQDTWYNVVGVKEGKNMSVYIDGSIVVSGLKGPTNVTYGVVATGLTIGTPVESSYFNEYFNGSIDEVMIINKSLTGAEVLNIYNQNFARFHETGTHVLNKTISSGDNRVNISLNLLADQFNPSITNISLKVWDGSAWSGEANMTNGVNQTFTIDDSTTQLNMTFTYQSNASRFWSPILLPPITYGLWTAAAADSEYPIFSNYWDDNASLIDAGTGHFNVTLLSTNGTVWLEIDGSNITATNASATPTLFNTTATLSSAGDYAYLWHSWGNGSSENFNKSVERSYTVNASELIPPDVTINTPLNQSYSTTTIVFNFTAVDTVGMGTCLYTMTNGVTNYTMTNTSTSPADWVGTNTTMNQGSHQVFAYCNDTTNNLNMTENITFFIDTVNPEITIRIPQPNEWIALSTVDFNVSSNENLSSCLLTFDSGVNNKTMTEFNSTWFNHTETGLAEGNHTTCFYCNDTTNNLNATECVDFYTDSIYPLINFTDPTPPHHNTTTSLSVEINVSFTELNLRNFTYNWDGINYSLYDNNLVLLLNLNNQSGIGENDTYVVDVSNSSNNGTVVGTNITTGKFGTAFNFTMEDFDYINLSNKEFGLGSTEGQPITISAWVNVNEGHTLSGKSFPIIDNQYNYDKEGFQLQLSTSSGVILQTGNATRSSKYSFNKSDCYFPNQWTHVVVVVEDDYLDAPRIYIDGYENRSDGNCSGGEWQAGLYNYQKTVLPTNPVKDTFIGGSITLTENHMFNGTIDEVMVWNKALNASEILQLYKGSLYKYNQTSWNYYANQSNLTSPYQYNYSACALDKALNLNCTESRYVNITQVIDTMTPEIIIEEPTPHNEFVCSNSYILNISINEDWGGEALWSFDSFVTNTTMTNTSLRNFNFTNSSAIDGSYQINFSVNDTSGNRNMSEWVNFTVDLIIPAINITSPLNKTYTSQIEELINYTFTEVNAGTCQYSTDMGVTNVTITCGDNVTGPDTSNEGSNTWMISANDSCGHLNVSFVTFFVDSLAPDINITSPLNKTYNIPINHTLNVTDVNGVAECWYSVTEGGSNVSMVNLAGDIWNYTEPAVWSDGGYKAYYWCNDTYGNINNTENISFEVDATQAPPVIVYPANDTYSVNITSLNYTYVGADYCWWSLNGGAVNSTTVSAGTNFTDVSSAEGSNNLSLYCNDSVNNFNQTSVVYWQDSIFPNVNITYPINTTYSVAQTELNITFSETNSAECWWTNNSGTTNYTVTCNINITGMNSTDGSNTWIYYANDSVAHESNSSVTFYIDLSIPDVTINTPLNQSYSTTTIVFNFTATDTVGMSTCLYTLTSGVTNYTMTNASGSPSDWNATNTTMLQGSHQVFAYCNDTTNNLNMTENITFFIDSTPPNISGVMFWAINSSGDVLGGADYYNTSSLEEIEKMKINFTLTDKTGFGNDIVLYYTANGSGSCALGNLQSTVCYNSSDNSWIEVQNGTNTTTFDDDMIAGDYLNITYIEINSTYRDYTIIVDEHYNPNVFKHYEAEYNSSNIKWQDGADQRITQDNEIIVIINQDLVPLDADQYKLDFRVNYTTGGNEPKQPLEAYACNSSYSVGNVETSLNCMLITEKLPSELQDDGAKFRGIFTKQEVDSLVDIKYIVLETDENNPNKYYTLKTINATAIPYTTKWNYTTDGGDSWANLGDGYETELNINWFYDGASPTEFLFKVFTNDSLSNNANSSIYNLTWNINPNQNYPPLIDIIVPTVNSTNNGTIEINWTTVEPNDDSYTTNITAMNETDTINIDLGLPDTFSNITWDTTAVADGLWNITVESCENETTDLFCGNATHQIIINNTVLDAVIPGINYTDPTKSDWTTVDVNYTYVNVTITEANYENNSFTLYNESLNTTNLVGYWNFDKDLTKAYDISGNNNYGDVVGGTVWNSAGKLNGAFEFNGTTDFIQRDVDPVGGYPFTIAAWVKPEDNSGNSQVVLDLVDASGTSTHYGIFENDNAFWILARNASDTSIWTTSNATTFGEWYHVVGVFTSATDRKLYVNGTLENSSVIDVPYNVIAVDRFAIGRAGDVTPESYLNGTIDEVMMWDRSLTAEEITSLYARRVVNYTTYDTENENITWSNLENGWYHYYADVLDTTGNYNSTEIRNINISLILDTFPPYFTTIPANVTHAYYTTLGVDYDATDETGFGNYTVNDTRFVINNSGWLRNETTFGVGSYLINITINDSINNLNSTLFQYNVTQVVSIVNLTLNDTQGNLSITEGDTTDFNCSTLTGEASAYLTLYNDSVLVTNGTSPIGNTSTFNTAGSFNVTCYYEATQNYTNSNETWWVNVTAIAVDSTPPYFDELPENQTIVYGNEISYDLNATDETSFDCFAVNDTDFTIDCTGLLTNTSSIGVGITWLNITINDSTNNLNSTIIYVNITQETGSVYAWINHLRANYDAVNDSGQNKSNIWLNGTLQTGEGNINLTLNGTQINYGASPLSNLTNLTIGFYNLTSWYDGNENFTASSEVWWINISIATPSVITGLDASDMILGYNADLIKFEDGGMDFTYRR